MSHPRAVWRRVVFGAIALLGCSCHSAARGDATPVHRFDERGLFVEAGLIVDGRPAGCWLRRREDGENRILSVYNSRGSIVVDILVDSSSVSGSSIRVDIVVPGEDAIWRINRALELTCYQRVGDVDAGYYFQFWGTGGIHLTGTMSDGRREGLWRDFKQDGSLFMEGHYLQGQRVGSWRIYDEDGEFKECPAEKVGSIYGQ